MVPRALTQAGKRVLELGCGVGALPSIACGLALPLPAEITLSDYDAAALKLAATNAEANGVACGQLVVDFTAPPRFGCVENARLHPFICRLVGYKYNPRSGCSPYSCFDLPDANSSPAAP